MRKVQKRTELQRIIQYVKDVDMKVDSDWQNYLRTNPQIKRHGKAEQLRNADMAYYGGFWEAVMVVQEVLLKYLARRQKRCQNT